MTRVVSLAPGRGTGLCRTSGTCPMLVGERVQPSSPLAGVLQGTTTCTGCTRIAGGSSCSAAAGSHQGHHGLGAAQLFGPRAAPFIPQGQDPSVPWPRSYPSPNPEAGGARCTPQGRQWHGDTPEELGQRWHGRRSRRRLGAVVLCSGLWCSCQGTCAVGTFWWPRARRALSPLLQQPPAARPGCGVRGCPGLRGSAGVPPSPQDPASCN